MIRESARTAKLAGALVLGVLLVLPSSPATAGPDDLDPIHVSQPLQGIGRVTLDWDPPPLLDPGVGPVPFRVNTYLVVPEGAPTVAQSHVCQTLKVLHLKANLQALPGVPDPYFVPAGGIETCVYWDELAGRVGNIQQFAQASFARLMGDVKETCAAAINPFVEGDVDACTGAVKDFLADAWEFLSQPGTGDCPLPDPQLCRLPPLPVD